MELVMVWLNYHPIIHREEIISSERSLRVKKHFLNISAIYSNNRLSSAVLISLLRLLTLEVETNNATIP